MQKPNDDGVVNSSPTSVSSGYCSQWMSPNDYCSSKQSASERTLCTESEFESDNGVNQKLLREFHCIRPKTRRDRSKFLPSGVQAAKKKLTCARQHKKSVHLESKASKCVLLRLNSRSFPYGGHVVPSSSPDLCLNELVESPLKRYSVNSGHPITSDKLLASVSVSASSSLSKKCSKWSKKSLMSLCACKIRSLTVSICRLPAGMKSMNVKNIGNSLCWFQSSAHMFNSKVRHKRTKNDLKQLHSNIDIIQLQSNSDCKQLQSCSYLKQLQSQHFKHHKSKSDVKCAKLSHGKKELALTGGDRQRQSKCDVKHRKSNKCKDSSREADIEELHKVTEENDGCGVIHKSRNVSVKRKSLESYNCNAGQMQRASFTKTERQNPVHLCRISDFYRPLKKRFNLQHQYSVKVTDATYGSSDSTVHESPLSHCVSASGFHSIKDKLDSCMSTSCCNTVFSSGKNQKLCDTSENLILKNHHTRRKVKRRITGKSECRSQQCHWRPCYSAFHRAYPPNPVHCKYVLPNSCHRQSSVYYQKHRRRSTNTEACGKGVLTNETDRILSHHKSSYLTDVQNRLPEHYSESGVKPDCRNLFDTFLNEIPSTSQQNLTEEITSKPEMSSIQNNGKHHNNDLVLKSDYSAKDLGLLESSDLSVQLRTENSGTELFEPIARLLDTNDDTYSDISDDILPDTVSNPYDMFSDISDCIPDDVPVNERTNGDKLSERGRNMLPDSGALWANNLHILWLQSQCFSPPTSNISVEIIKTNVMESHNEKIKEALMTPADSSCSDNHDDVLNCQKPCSTVIQNNFPVSDNTCHTEIQTNSSSQRRPCSVMVTTISNRPCCSEVEEGDSMSKRCCSSGEIQTSEGPSPSDRACCSMENQTSEKPGSTESMNDSSLCERPGSFGINQTSVFISDSVGPFSGYVQEGCSPTSTGAAEESMASDGPCTYKEQRLYSHGRPCSNESKDGISPCAIPYSLDMNHKSANPTSEGLCSAESDEKTLNSAASYFNAVESTNKGLFSTQLQEETVTSCANYIQNESAFGIQSSVEIPDKTLTPEEPRHLLKTQKRFSIAEEIVYVQNEVPVCEHSSSEITGKALASKTPCSVETQKAVSISKESVSIEIQNELSAFGSGNILDTIHNSEGFRSSNIYKGNLNLIYEGPYESGVNDAEQVPEIPCSGESYVLEMPFSEEGPAVSEICNAKEGHLVLGATYSNEGSLVSDVTCFKEVSLTSEGPCCKVGHVVSEVISEDSCSREELFISEGPCSEERPLVSEGPGSNNGPLISDRSYANDAEQNDGPPVSNLRCVEEGCFSSEASCSDGILVSEAPCLAVTQKEILAADAKFSGVIHEGCMIREVPGSGMLQVGLTGSQEGFSNVQEVEDLLTAGVSCLSETNDVSLNLEDLFPFVLQEPSEGFDDPLNYEDFLSCEMQEDIPVGSQIDNTQENSLIAPTSCIANFQEQFSKSDIQKGLLTSGNSSCKDLQVPESNVDTSSKSESFLAKFYEFTNVWRPSAAPESESDGDNTDHENDVDSLDEIRNECITDANRTSCEAVPFVCQVTVPHCPARAKTELWLQEYQSQMLENQQKTHKNWKLLASVNDDPGSGRRCGQRKGASGNRSRKRKSSPGANKTRHQPKRVCTMTRSSEQTAEEPSESFMFLQQALCGVDLTSQSNFSVDGVMANFQNMILNGDPSMLSVFIDQANTWLSMENIETTIDLADLGHSDLNIYSERELTVPLASESLTSDDNTLSTESRQSDLLDLASALPIQQPESIVSSGLPGSALNSAASTDAQTFAMLSENGGNVESLNLLSSDAGNTLQTVVPGFNDVPELDAEMLQYLWSVFPQSGPAGELPAISYIQSNGIVTNTDVNRGIIYVLNHSNCFTQLAECSQILGCDPVLDCNKDKTESQCQVGQTFTPVLILTNGNNISAKVDNSTNTEQIDSGVCFAQNSSETMTAVSSEIDSQPDSQNNCPVMDIGEFMASDTASAANFEERCMVDVVESNSALLSEKHDALESQKQSSNTLVLEKNCEISNNSGSSSAPMTENYSDDCTDQNSAAALLEKGCSSGAVLIEKGSELNRNECSETVMANRLSCSDSTSVCPLQNDLSKENNQSQNVFPTGNKLLNHQSYDVEQLADSCRIESASGNSAIHVDQQGTSGSECSSDADLHQMSSAVPSSELNDLSVGEDSLSDKSDPFVLTCDDAGDNAAIFWEESEQDNCSDISDVIMLECSDSPQSHQESISETVAMSSPQEQCTAQETGDASKDHIVSAVILQKGNQSSSANGNQKTKSFHEGTQENSEEGNQKSAGVGNEKSSEEGSQKTSEDSENLVEKFNKNCYEGSQNFLEGDNNKSSEETCQALMSGSCEEEVVCSNLAKSTAINEPNLLPNSRPMLLHPHDSVMILVDKLTSKENSKVKTKLKKSKPVNRAEGKESNTTESQLFNLDAPHSIRQNTDKRIDKLPSIEINMVKSKLRKSTPTRKAKSKTSKSKSISKAKTNMSSAIESQNLRVVALDSIAQNRNLHDIRQTICSGSVTEPSFDRSEQQTEGNVNKSRAKETSYSSVQTVKPAKVNSCTIHTTSSKRCQNGIKLRIVKLRSGIWQAKRSSDPKTLQDCSHKDKPVASASSDDCMVSSNNLRSYQDGIYISDESDDDSADCICVGELSCPPKNRLTSAKRTITNQRTSFLPTSSSLHRFGCTCLSCAEQQFLYGRDNTMSPLFRDNSLRQGLMRYKPPMPANRSPLQVYSVASVGQPAVVIDDLNGSNSDMPIHIL